MQFAVALAAAAVSMLVIDLVWLGVIAPGFYKEQLGPLMAPSINWTAGLAFYALYVVGVVVLVVMPALAAGSLTQAALYGALFGLVAYGTYDLTNLATLRGFPLKLAIVDMAWGTFLTATVATISTWTAQRFG